MDEFQRGLTSKFLDGTIHSGTSGASLGLLAFDDHALEYAGFGQAVRVGVPHVSNDSLLIVVSQKHSTTALAYTLQKVERVLEESNVENGESQFNVTKVAGAVFQLRVASRAHGHLIVHPQSRIQAARFGGSAARDCIELGRDDLKLGRAAHVFGRHEAKLNVRYPLEGVVPFHVQFVRGRRLIALFFLDHIYFVLVAHGVVGNQSGRTNASNQLRIQSDVHTDLDIGCILVKRKSCDRSSYSYPANYSSMPVYFWRRSSSR
jgi:hypothetical protein